MRGGLDFSSFFFILHIVGYWGDRRKVCHFVVEVNAVRGGFLEGALENVNIYRS